MAFSKPRIEIIDVPSMPVVTRDGPPVTTEVKVEKPAKPNGMTAKDAVQQCVYVVKGKRCVFICQTSGKQSFAPVTGEAPILVDSDEPIEAYLEDAMILPPDAPAPKKTEVEAIPERVAPVEVEAKEEKPKKTRAKKTVDAAPVQAPVEEKKEEPSFATECITLYFGCWPSNTPLQTLDAHVAKLQTTMLQAFGIDEKKYHDIRLVNGDTLGFGRWKPYFQVAVKTMPPPPGAYYVTSTDERVNIAVETLLSMGVQTVTTR